MATYRVLSRTVLPDTQEVLYEVDVEGQVFGVTVPQVIAPSGSDPDLFARSIEGAVGLGLVTVQSATSRTYNITATALAQGGSPA